MTKKTPSVTGWAVYGRHGSIYVTEGSSNFSTIGRLQVYLREADAKNNAHELDTVIKVQIIKVE